jgi:Leucine-rich repeat (LRR) protein
MEKLIIIVILGLLSSVHSQYCEFSDPTGKYTCTLNGNGVIFEERVDEPVPGAHNINPNLTDSDVTKVLSNGPISEQMIKRFFNFFTELETMEFTNGDVKKIENSIFYNCTKLTTLTINKGDFSTIGTKSFEKCAALKKITLREDHITTFASQAFDGLVELQELDLTGNQIRTPPAGTFNALVELRLLRISSNFIESLPSSIFSQNTKMEELYLENNKIEQLLKAHVGNTKSLKIVNFENNLLNRTERGFFDGLTLTSANFLINQCIDKNYETVNMEVIKTDFETCFLRNGGLNVGVTLKLILLWIGAIIGMKFL